MKEKSIYLNLKRFDIPKDEGGINSEFDVFKYGEIITKKIEKMNLGLPITIFFQESNLISAIKKVKKINIGCQGVHYDDVKKGHNFGAFTSLRTAKSMKAIGVKSVIIGHSEERANLNNLLSLFKGNYDINLILNEEIKRAKEANLNVLYCVGEKEEELNNKYEVIKNQVLVGLKDIDLDRVSIAYEPLWAIGPKKTPPNSEYINDIAKYIKSIINTKVVYGGGLKKENAKMIASIPSLDGGLIALTRFNDDFGFYLDDFKEIVEIYKRGLLNEN